jgi:hypothetical protein
MMDKEAKEIMFHGFFDELGSIQKEASFGTVLRAGGQMLRNPVTAAKGLGATVSRGWKGTHGLAKGRKGISGVGTALLGSPQGQAALLGTGLLGAGALAGGGYLAGRSRR